MTTGQSPALDELIAAWRDWMERRDAMSVRDVDELESHLRDRIDALGAAGLTDDEAFLIAVKRLGSMDELSREYAAEHSGRLWKQLVLTETAGIDDVDAPAGMLPFARRTNGLPVALALGVGAGIAVKATEVLTGDPELVLRNVSVLVLPFLAAWFAWRRRPPLTTLVGVAAVFAVVALALNLYPFDGGSSNVTVATQNSATAVLATIGAIVALWFVTGVVDAEGVWRSDRTRMDFLRFSGEWLVYYVLIALVGGALSGLTVAVFASIGIDVMPFIGEWVLPCGAAGAVLVSAWLVGAKQRVIENIAPVLTKVFTPLFTLMMLALIVAAVMQWNLVDGSRDLLIAFDLVLVVAVALLVYSISARDPGL
ncbi:MAG: permease prefix domain 1-containing protein, partial [Agromyces sp.]